MKPQPIEDLLSSQNPTVVEVANALNMTVHYTHIISAQFSPYMIGLFARELGTPCDIEDIGDNMSKYSIDLEIRGDVCKVWAVGESISK